MLKSALEREDKSRADELRSTAADVHLAAVLTVTIVAAPAGAEALAVERGTREHANATALGHAVGVARTVVVARARQAAESAGEVTTAKAARVAVAIARASGTDDSIDIALAVTTTGRDEQRT